VIWWWGPGWGWIGGLISAVFWIAIIVLAVVLLRRELPNLHLGYPHPSTPALTLLEERYARGEISREDFLHRREVLLQTYAPTLSGTGAESGQPGGETPRSGADPTEPIPPAPPGSTG